MDLSNRGPLSEYPFSLRTYESDLAWLRKEAARKGISIATVVRIIIAQHVDAQTAKGK
jgi:hypothetical protein